MLKRLSLWVLVGLVGVSAGCGVMPRPKLAWNDKGWLNRARSTHSSDRWPDEKGIPALIARLDDRDEVVRMAANQELKQRTGQDFGFVAWSEDASRKQAVTRWRQWWDGQKAGLAKSGRLP